MPIWHLGMGSGCSAPRGSGEGGRQRALALLFPALSSAAVPRLCGSDTRVPVQRASTLQCSVLCHPSPGLLFHFPFELSSCDCGPLSVDPITRALAVLPCAEHLCSALLHVLSVGSVVLEHCQCWLPGVSCQGRHIPLQSGGCASSVPGLACVSVR